MQFCRVKDNGALEGIDEGQLEATLIVIKDLVIRANLSIESTEIVPLISANKFICQVRIELDASDRFSALNTNGVEKRALFLGATGSGKTTLLSVLSDWGTRDDGKGKMRTRLLHHRHELLSGSTSSVTHQPLVFLKESPIPQSLTDESVLLQLERRRELLGEGKVVQLVDSAGKLRFDRTVFSVLTSASHQNTFAFLVLEAPNKTTTTSNDLIPSQTLTTFHLLESLGIPAALLINKIDQSSTEAIYELLESFSRQIEYRKSLEIYDESGVDPFSTGVLPVLLVSAVSGDFLVSLAHFLYSVSPTPTSSPSSSLNPFIHAQESASSALIIEQVAHLVNVGTVVYGQVAFGSICVGDVMVLGPQPVNTEILPVKVKSIQRLKCTVNQALPSQHVSIALEFPPSKDQIIRKGMALLCLPSSSSSLTLKPLRRIIAELEQIAGNLQTRFTGTLYVMGQRFPATLDVQPRSIRRTNSSTNRPLPSSPAALLVCLVSFSEKRPATVFLFPSASIVFVGNGRREKFSGKVIDYFA